MKTVPFLLNCRNTLKCPTELFDCNCETVMSLYRGEPVFPLAPFNAKKYSSLLRSAGLKSEQSVTALNVYEIVDAIKYKGTSPQNYASYVRACAVMKFISSKPSLLDVQYSLFCTLFEDLLNLGNTISWLPVCSTPPPGYPTCLLWKGSAYRNSLVSQQVGILPLNSKLPLITGSQLLFMQDADENKLTLALKPSDYKIAEAVVNHFIRVTEKHIYKINPEDREKIVNWTYMYLNSVVNSHDVNWESIRKLVKGRKWIWLDEKDDFVESSIVAVKKNPSFFQNLEPFIYTLPLKYANFENLFKMLGVLEQVSAEQIVSVLMLIKENIHTVACSRQLWQMVRSILEWVASNQNDEFDRSKLLVPVNSEAAYPVLKFVDEVAYSDSQFLMLAATNTRYKIPPIVHPDISIGLVRKLGVKSLSKHLGIVADELPQDVGQQEPLIKRLENVLKDYKDGLTIIKELLQNADDAEATELNIVYDSRNHSSHNLLFPGMAKAHGPALIVHNDKTFTDDDFKNITKLAGATKEDKPLKIGKFGIGFCSVYHITDVPSFVSGEWLYIFDPTLKHLENEVQDPAQPGQKIRCTCPLLRGSRQFDPYHSIFKYDPGQSYQGTIFRLPFRITRSDISGKCYDWRDIDRLKNQLVQEGSKLLLFLRNVKKITFSEFKQGDEKPTEPLIRIQKADADDGICITPGVNHIMLETTYNTSVESEDWIVSNSSENTGSTDYQSATVACKLESCTRFHQYYRVAQVCGETFCSLPLGLQSGLPVHVSANFAVTTDRRGIWTSSSSQPDKEVMWNRELMKSVIPNAYVQLLIALREISMNCCTRLKLSDYCFHCLWPLEAQLKVMNPWSIFIAELYKLILDRALFYSQSRDQWMHLNQSKFISKEVFSSLSLTCKPPKCVVRALEILKVPIVDLPTDFYHQHLLSNMIFIEETEFIVFFISNISSFSSDINARNEIILLILELYSWTIEQTSNFSEHDLLASTPCIPCTPHGKLKLCKDLVDSSAPIARLFEPGDSLFPITMLCRSPPAMRAMRALGLQTKSVSYELLASCAKGIQELYFTDKIRAYEKMLLIFKCIEENHHSKVTGSQLLKNIPFLPVMPSPKNYLLAWHGKENNLLPPCQLKYGDKLPSLVGSQIAILDTSVLKSQPSYGKIPSYILNDIGVNKKPSVSTVIDQFMCLIKLRPELASADAIGSMYSAICSFLEERLKQQDEVKTSGIGYEIVDLSKVKCLPCVWTGQQFVEPRYVAMSWKCDGPILYPVPEALRFRSFLRKALGCKDSFSVGDLFNGLSFLYKQNRSRPLADHQCGVLVREILSELDNNFSIEIFKEFSDRDNVMVPDTDFILQRVGDLVFNDVEWCSDYKIANSCISPSLAEKLGMTFIRRKTLQKYERKYRSREFGQREDLTHRIANVLREYPFDVTFIKEILQNADDAKATKLCIILDTRQLVTEKTKMISDNWKELQGPALLFWNNSTFTEKDLQGIQDLGIGGKRGDSETIGQFGIGFNVVYHVTDCPSFITCVGGESLLCVFDPLCRYVPEADVLHPGRQFEVNDEFWKKFFAIKPGYYIDEVNGCPEYMKRDLWNGTLFRLPIRDKSAKYNKVFTESMSSTLKTASLLHHIKQWIEDVKFSLLFLKHLTDIQFYIIDGHHSRESMTLLASYSATLSEETVQKRASIERCACSFNSKQGCTPQVVMYPLTITSIVQLKSDTKLQMVDSKEIKEKWLVQEGVGDIDCLDQYWTFVPDFKPRHGLAAPLQPEQSKNGQIFCFLPLSLSSHMPVHINGQFILAANRRQLWKATSPRYPDSRSKWNENLMKAIASSYAHFLLHAIPHYVKKHYSDRICAIADLENYYKKFPTTTTDLLSNDVIKKLCEQNAEVLCSVKQHATDYETEWSPLKEEDKQENQSYMLFAPQRNKEETNEEFDKRKRLHSNLRCLLEDIGMNINSVPRFIWTALNNASKIPIAEGKQVFLFCKQFPQRIGTLPCPIEQTSIHIVEHFTALLKYMCTYNYLKRCLQFPGDYIGAPFLLTADGFLHVFTKDNSVILSKYCHLFSQYSGSLFANPSLVEIPIDPAYFYRPVKENFDFVAGIFEQTIPQSLQTSTIVSYQDKISKEFLSNIWKCITNDPVFNCHLTAILSRWALIPSLQNQLFLYNSRSLLPVKRLKLENADEDMTPQNKLCLKTFRILLDVQMPILDTDTVSSSNCLQSLCSSMSNPESILQNLAYLHQKSPVKLDIQAIGILFQYFSNLAFGSTLNATNQCNMCSLPFFQNIDGNLTSLEGKKVFVWPNNLDEKAGLSLWLSQSDIVILTRDGEWTKLGASQAALGISEISAIQLYMKYIFPHFYLLSESDRYKHLEYVRDNFSWEIKKHKPFETFKCIENDQGELGFISDYCDPEVKLFNTFSSDFIFPHKKYHSKEWLECFRGGGLQQEIDMSKFEELCRRIEIGNHSELMQASADLLEHLLDKLCKADLRLMNNPMAENWRDNKQFLKIIFDISFVVAKDLPQLNWIVPQCTTNKIVKGGTTYHLTKLNGAAISDIADTVWTVRPIVRLPLKYSSLTIMLYHTGISSLLSNMGLTMNPSVSDISKNLQNIATYSEFTNLGLFDKYTVEIDESQDLLRVMSTIFNKLSDKTELQGFQSLASTKCIPVFAGNSTRKNWYVLVEPHCVIASSSVKGFQPYLNPLPNDLLKHLPVLEHFGVKSEVKFEHCCYALEKMYQCLSEPVDANTQIIFEKLLKRMYSILQDQSSVVNATTLYLPNTNLRMMPSTCLVYCDKKRYKNCKYTMSDSSNISVLWFPNNFESQAVNFCKFLPVNVRPIPLSCCKEQLFSPQITVTSTNSVTEELQKALLLIEKSMSVLEKILHHQCAEDEKSRKILKYFSKVLYGAKVVAVPNLTVTLHFTNSEASEEIAKCQVDYFIDESEHKRTTIFVDSSISDVNTALFKVQMPMASQILSVASLDSSEYLHSIITLLIKAQNEESLKIIHDSCDDKDTVSSLPSSSTIVITPKVGIPVPEYLHQMLDQDVRNIFKPGEWVAFETEQGVYMFTKISHPNVNEIGRMPDDVYSHRYFILIPDEEPRSVSILLLYKFRRSAHTHQRPTQAVVLHDGNNDLEERQSTSTPHAQHCKEEILKVIARLWKYEDNVQRGIIKRLYLQWHPDKNLDDIAFAHDVFTFLVNELEKMKIEKSFDEWHREASSHRQASDRWQMPSSDSEYFEKQAKPDIHQANRWLRQARLDKQALDVLLTSGNDKLSGHVCFLAREGVEKALKAGMYIVHGGIQSYLKSHQLYPLFSNIAHKLSEESCQQVRLTVCVLEEYYNDTRWPNKWLDISSIPADHYTPEDAQRAKNLITSVIETIEKLVRSVSDLA